MRLSSALTGYNTAQGTSQGIASICIYSRTAHLLQLERRGVSIPEDGGTISDPQLLMEVMEQRERIEETDDPVVLQTMLQENKLLQQATTEVRSTTPQAHNCTGSSLSRATASVVM